MFWLTSMKISVPETLGSVMAWQRDGARHSLSHCTLRFRLCNNDSHSTGSYYSITIT